MIDEVIIYVVSRALLKSSDPHVEIARFKETEDPHAMPARAQAIEYANREKARFDPERDKPFEIFIEAKTYMEILW